MRDHLSWYWLEYVIGLIILGLIVMLVLAVNANEQAAEAFFAECEQHEPHYKCVAMWRSGETHTIVTPVPVIVR